MNLTNASYCSESFCCRICSYSSRTLSVRSLHILSQMMVIWRIVKIGFSLCGDAAAAAAGLCADDDDMGSGELGGDERPGLPGASAADEHDGRACIGANCLLRLILLSSSLRFSAISPGVRTDSWKALGDGAGRPIMNGEDGDGSRLSSRRCLAAALWSMGTHRRRLDDGGPPREWIGLESKSSCRGRLSVTHAMADED